MPKLKLISEKFEALLTYLNDHDGVLADYPDFLDRDKIKFKKNKTYHLKHSVIKSKNGTLYAIFRNGQLGKGANGKVKLAQNLSTHEICAVKIKKMRLGITNLNERIALEKTGLYFQHQDRISTQKDYTKEYLFTPLIIGSTLKDLKKLLKKHPEISLTKLEQATLLRSFLNSLLLTKKHNIFHHDLTSKNIMIDINNMKAIIIDYGNCSISTDQYDNERDDAQIYTEYHALDRFFKYVITNQELKVKLYQTIDLNMHEDLKTNILKELQCAINYLDKVISEIKEKDHNKESIPSDFQSFVQYDLDIIQNLKRFYKV